MDKIVGNLLDWTKNKPKEPVQIQFHLTDFCNLNCSFCPTKIFVKDLDKKNELSTNDWLRVIEEGNKLGVKEWHLCGGGEPLFFYERARKIMLEIKEEKKYGDLITNGTLFKEDFIKELVEAEWDRITFSLDGPALVNDKIRGPNVFKKVVENIKLFSYWKKKLNRENPRLCIHVVVCNLNMKYIPYMVKLAKKLNCQELVINALNLWSEDIKKFRVESKELQGYLEKALILAKKLNVETNIADFIHFDLFEKANKMDESLIDDLKDVKKYNFLSMPCFRPWYSMVIFPDGRVLPCFELSGEGESLRKKSLKEIWFGDYFKSIRNEIKEKRLSSSCSKCNSWNFPKVKEIRNELGKHLS